MNEDTNINEYVKKLPQPVQNLLNEGVWEERVNEISKKYSLTPEQSVTLSNIVLLILTFITPPEEIKQTVMEDLGISDLLSEQICSDLETRVFEYAAKKIEEGNKKTSIQTTSLELKPVNLPMVEKNEPVRVIPPFQNEVLDKQTPSSNIGVPRYADNVSSVSVGKNFSSNSGSIIDQKMNNVTPGITEAPKKYDKDPYREELG